MLYPHHLEPILVLKKFLFMIKPRQFTWVEVNQRAIEHNIREFRKMIGPKVLLMPVIKSNAYGHGFLEIAQICDKHKDVDRFCVVSLDEAMALRNNKITKPIIILAIYDLNSEKINWAIKNKIIFPLYTLEQAKTLNQIGERLQKKITVHLKIDIGTSRLGILANELPSFFISIANLRYLDFEGILGHFSSSEENSKRTHEQNKIFQKAIKIANEQGISPRLRHIACSAAAIIHPPTHYNAIRLGLALYGLDSSVTAKKKIKLKPALSWHTTIIQLKTVPTGSKIGYNGTYTTRCPTKLAILPVGYWDGYGRSFSNRAFVIINGKRCSIRGRICMNLTIVDVTKLKNVMVGDRATLIGKNGKTSVTADELSLIAKTINYEIVTRINPILPRIIT